SDDVWIIQFYAPWCSLCKQLDPIWRQVASELKSLGSPVNVGQSDATVNTVWVFFRWKKNMKYNYSGAKTRDGIMTWTLRVSGPTVRSLLTPQIFQLSRERHQVMFVYVGTTSELRGNFTSVAEEMIVHTHFFSAIKDVLPKVRGQTSVCSYLYHRLKLNQSEEVGGDLRRWVNKERFPLFAHIDSFTLYAMGDSGNDITVMSSNMYRKLFKCLLERVATERRHLYKRIFYFGYMNQMDYIKGLMMSDVIIPSFVVVNLTNDGYFLPDTPVEAELQLVGFLEGIINGSVQSQGGNSVFQRIRRLVYEVNVTLTVSFFLLLFPHGPLLGCFLVSILSIIMAVLYFLCCKARRSLPYEGDDVTERKKLMNKKSD
uniref:protein disulfide-isomerase n=1 Tax=Cynoglossus semilaevis TaxID=244447 RepID=A0A3P8WA18_CYNSE